jgi:carbapenem resistance CarG-like protein
MSHLRLLTLGCVLALTMMPSLAMDVHDYVVVKLHRGLNNVDLGGTGQHATVVVGHRENWNAHSFEVTTIYLPGESAADLDIVGVWDDQKESLYLTTSGGADCTLLDFRLLRSVRGAPAALVVADRQLRESFYENSPVTFKVYVLVHNDSGLPGKPTYWFKLVETRSAKAAYCDVGVALSRELGLANDSVRGPP